MTGQSIIEVVCKVPLVSRYINVSIPSNPGAILTLCEVEVIGIKGMRHNILYKQIRC